MSEETALLDAPVEETVQDQPADSTQEQQSQQPTDQQPTDKFDQRNRPDPVRKMLADLKTNNPDAAPHIRSVNDTIGREAAYKAAFPTVQEARQAKVLLDSIGGRDGLTKLQQQVQEARTLRESLDKGDGASLKDVKGVDKLFPQMANQVRTSNPDAFRAFLAPEAAKFLHSEGVIGTLSAVETALQKGDTEEALRQLSLIGPWYNKLGQGSDQQRTDPQQQEFERKEQEFNQRVEQADVSATNGDVNAHAVSVIDAQLKNMGARVPKLSADATADLKQAIWNEIQSQRNADENYKLTIAQKWQGASRVSDSAAYMKQQTDLLARQAAEKVINLRYPKTTGAPRVSATAPIGTGEALMDKKPNDLDLDKTSMDDLLAKRGVRTNGQKVRWK